VLSRGLFGMGVLIAAVLFAACGDGKKKKSEQWLATVASVQGKVALRAKADGGLVPAKPKMVIYFGGKLETGPNSTAVLEIRGGGQLEVKPNSRIRFGRTQKKRLQVALLSGQVEGSTPAVEGSGLTILVGGKRVKIGKKAKTLVSTKEVKAVFGDAVVGEVVVKQGKGLAFELEKKDGGVRKDASVPRDASTADIPVVRPDKGLVFYLKNTGRKVIRYRLPGEKRFRRLGPGKVIEIPFGTQLRLARGARGIIIKEKDAKKGDPVRGPAKLLVEKSDSSLPSGKVALKLVSVGRTLAIIDRGRIGKAGPKRVVDGVTIATKVTWKRIDVQVRKDRRRRNRTVIVNAGEAILKDTKGNTLRLGAGQRATIKKGRFAGPITAKGGLLVDRSGKLRLFAPGGRRTVTFKWDPAWEKAAVEISRSRTFKRPFFSDGIKRNKLTLPGLYGTIYWRARPLSPDGKLGKGVSGRLTMVVDTSYKVLRTPAPSNAVNHWTKGVTTISYQNALPRITFQWRPVRGATRYKVRVRREPNLSRDFLKYDGRKTSYRLRAGRIGEGRYMWYVSARVGRKWVGSDPSWLRIKYDNATPNVQIVYPRDNLTVSKSTIEVRGVTLRGSTVFVNGQQATLDSAYRFRHPVELKPGTNRIHFRVISKRGAAIYLRTVRRR
jgi:hypothetical protein